MQTKKRKSILISHELYCALDEKRSELGLRTFTDTLLVLLDTNKQKIKNKYEKNEDRN